MDIKTHTEQTLAGCIAEEFTLLEQDNELMGRTGNLTDDQYVQYAKEKAENLLQAIYSHIAINRYTSRK